jgi:hypothetical protein
MEWDEECHLIKMIDKKPNFIMIMEIGWQTTQKGMDSHERYGMGNGW